MCTAVSFHTKDHYFGRNLDYEFAYNQTVTVTPRHYPFVFRKMPTLSNHYAMIGMAFVQENYPLYYDATNEKGLSIAGLNFPGYADYKSFYSDKDNITPFELIPYLLGQCATVAEARKLLERLNLYAENFSEQLPLSPLHWMLSDQIESIVIESVCEGLKIYDNPVGVMTNSPPFDFHMLNLANYMALSRNDPENKIAPDLPLKCYSRGMGAIGLPGDLSSASRFIKAAFTRLNSICGDNEEESVSQFFHILASVEQQKGCCEVANGFEYTIYSSCCNMEKGIYYYTTYNNSRITAIDMYHENLDGNTLINYPLLDKQPIFFQNKQ